MRPHGNRARLGGVLIAVAAALALVALPGLASSHPNHDPSADAGTIQSFDEETGLLTIDLADGGSISGLVTRRTHIHCDNGHHHGRHGLGHQRRGGKDELGDDHGRHHGLDSSEDHHGNGDDPPGHDGTVPGRSEGPGHGDEHSARCGVDDLEAGATVKLAVLVLVDGKAIYTAVVLPKPAMDDEEDEAAATPAA